MEDVVKILMDLPEGTTIVAEWLCGYDNAGTQRNAHQKNRAIESVNSTQQTPESEAEEVNESAVMSTPENTCVGLPIPAPIKICFPSKN